MVGKGEGDKIEDVVIIGGLIAIQFVYAGNAVFLGYLMSLGIRPLTIVIFVSLATFLIIFPVAFYFERSNWPSTFSLKLILQFLLLAFGGAAFQSLLLKGIKLTSPAMGTAMPNLAPGLIFIIAWTTGMEKVNIRCTYSKVKILGTLMCVFGALTMSIMQSISPVMTARQAEANQLSSSSLSSAAPDFIFDKRKIIGCLCLIAAIFMLSSTIVLQSFTLRGFPAPMSLSAATSLLGAFMTVIAQILEHHHFTTGLALVNVGDMLGYSLLAGAVGGLCLSFNGWALKKRGPVMVSMFSPIGTVISVILSVVTLGDTINIGSLVGMLLMFTGLYFVLWAKGREGYSNGDRIASEFDAETPLLS